MSPGLRFGRWTVLSFVDGRNWLVRCDCGTEKQVTKSNLQKGKTSSCGCLRHDLNFIHGHTTKTSSAYGRWNAMKQRCTNPKHKRFADWGGRGITVCERWNDFLNFLADMGEPPSPELTIDRIDNDKGYSKGNCQWATRLQQTYNRR
jgi:hypothetical protein